MEIKTESYFSQRLNWPHAGQHILAHHDDETIVVYQAYRPSIARYAIAHGHFGGPDFSLNRMSWIKPNFLWMMYRAGWATKLGQEMILGLRISRHFFDHILEDAVASSYEKAGFSDHAVWQEAVANSCVRLQWDPDHTPSGAKEVRRAIQLGLRGEMLKAFAGKELLEVIDFTPFVVSQRIHAEEHEQAKLILPVESVYQPESESARRGSGIDQWPV